MSFFYDRDQNVTGTIPASFTFTPSYGMQVSFSSELSSYEAIDNYIYTMPKGLNHLPAPAPKSDFGRDRKKQGQRCDQAINKCSFLGVSPSRFGTASSATTSPRAAGSRRAGCATPSAISA